MFLELFVKSNEPSMAVLKFVREELHKINSAGHKIRVECIKRVDVATAAMLKRRGINSLPSLICGTNVVAGARSIVAQISRLMGGRTGVNNNNNNNNRAAPPPPKNKYDDWMTQQIMDGVKFGSDKGKTKVTVEESDEEDGDDKLDMGSISKEMTARMQSRGISLSRAGEEEPPTQHRNQRANPNQRNHEELHRNDWGTVSSVEMEKEYVADNQANENLYATMVEYLRS